MFTNSAPATPFGQPKQTVIGQQNTTGQPSQPTSTGLFGQPSQPTSTGLFGQTPTTFGQPAPSTTTGLFGQSATNASFGQQPATGLFGQPASTFGQPAQSLLGQSTTAPSFGQSTTTGLFGQPAQSAAKLGQPTGLFGQQTGFGQSNTAGLFGQQAQNKAGAFGQPQPAQQVPADPIQQMAACWNTSSPFCQFKVFLFEIALLLQYGAS
jgi:nuclear pore complex protein Nup98-Nup96